MLVMNTSLTLRIDPSKVILASTTSAISPMLPLLRFLLKINPTIHAPIIAKIVQGKKPNFYALAKYMNITDATNDDNKLI